MNKAQPILCGVCSSLGNTHNAAIGYRVGFIAMVLLGFYVLTPLVYGVLWAWTKYK